MIHRIGILTSGGDAPGMNPTVRAVVRAGLSAGKEVYYIYDGYRGLVEGNIVKADEQVVEDIISRGGTVLRSARLPEFSDIKVREKGVEQLKKFGIDAIVVIGGDGSYKGAKALTKMGINCIGLPGTIDNDIVSSDYTIGFDTALNTIVESTSHIADTMMSHSRAAVIEVMGHFCGDLSLYAAIATGADILVTNERPLTEQQIIEKLKEIKAKGKKSALIMVSEKIFDVDQLAKKITEDGVFEARAAVLGHIQRGGIPTAADRILGARLGVRAVDLLMEGKGGRCVGIHNNHIVDYEIDEALSLPREDQSELYDVVKKVNG